MKDENTALLEERDHEDLVRMKEDEKEEQLDMLCLGVLAVIAFILSCAGAIIIST